MYTNKNTEEWEKWKGTNISTKYRLFGSSDSTTFQIYKCQVHFKIRSPKLLILSLCFCHHDIMTFPCPIKCYSWRITMCVLQKFSNRIRDNFTWWREIVIIMLIKSGILVMRVINPVTFLFSFCVFSLVSWY